MALDETLIASKVTTWPVSLTFTDRRTNELAGATSGAPVAHAPITISTAIQPAPKIRSALRRFVRTETPLLTVERIGEAKAFDLSVAAVAMIGIGDCIIIIVVVGIVS